MVLISMKILMLGGTGAIGKSLGRVLVENGHNVRVTSRKVSGIYDNILYIKGNAQDINFIRESIVIDRYDCIIDFMDYDTAIFKSNINALLSCTSQYVFLSSSRVYADSNQALTEESLRLLDISDDKVLLEKDEYPIHKAREEDYLKKIIFSYPNCSYTIIRPYITYNAERMQLGNEEKEEWLWRAYKGKKVVFPKALMNKMTTMSHSDDVAIAISCVINNDKAFNRVFHIAGAKPVSWKTVLDIYKNAFKKITGKEFKVHMIDEIDMFMKGLNCECQVKYDRLYNRLFDNSNIDRLCINEGVFIKYVDVIEGLEKSLADFLQNPKWRYINPKEQAYYDKVTKEIVIDFDLGIKWNIKYFLCRLFPKLTKMIESYRNRKNVK